MKSKPFCTESEAIAVWLTSLRSGTDRQSSFTAFCTGETAGEPAVPLDGRITAQTREVRCLSYKIIAQLSRPALHGLQSQSAASRAPASVSRHAGTDCADMPRLGAGAGLGGEAVLPAAPSAQPGDTEQ